MCKWWDQISSKAPGFGYNVNGSKTWLVTREGFAIKVREIFVHTTINITSEGCSYLGAPIGQQPEPHKVVWTLQLSRCLP